MKIIFTLVMLSLLPFYGSSQPKISREETRIWNQESKEWVNVSEKTYQYNIHKELTRYQESDWNDQQKKFIGKKLIISDYFDLRTLISEYRSIYFNDDFYWVLKDTSEYFLNEEGCNIRLNDNSEFTEWKWEYEYFENCLIKAETQFYKTNYLGVVHWNPYERVLYTYSSDKKIKKFYKEHYAGNDYWNLLYEGYEKYDDRGNVVESYSSEAPARLYENTYDHKDRLVWQKLYTASEPNAELTQRRESLYQYFEDENGFVIEMLLHRRYDDDTEYTTQTYLYENYCDGLKKIEEYIRPDGIRRQWQYEYDEPAQCYESKEINLRISPNPATFSVVVESEFMFEDTDILIFNSNGQLVLKIPFASRTDRREIDLGNLPNGVYHLQLRSPDRSAVKSFVIMK